MQPPDKSVEGLNIDRIKQKLLAGDPWIFIRF
jgi:hypothetical protein